MTILQRLGEKNLYRLSLDYRVIDTALKERNIRVIDTALKERNIKKKLYICQRHYRPDQILVNNSRTSVKPGEIPELNLPTKSFPSTPFQPRVSSATITTKRKCLELSSQSSPTLSSSVYIYFDEFKDRIRLLKLPTSWSVAIADNQVVFTSKDNIHMVPDFEIYVNEYLTFSVHVYLWKLPINHEIYTSNHHSLQNITLSNHVHALHSYELCVGIKTDIPFSSSALY